MWVGGDVPSPEQTTCSKIRERVHFQYISESWKYENPCSSKNLLGNNLQKKQGRLNKLENASKHKNPKIKLKTTGKLKDVNFTRKIGIHTI